MGGQDDIKYAGIAPPLEAHADVIATVFHEDATKFNRRTFGRKGGDRQRALFVQVQRVKDNQVNAVGRECCDIVSMVGVGHLSALRVDKV